MKFCFYTNLIIGIVCLLFEAGLVYMAYNSANFLRGGAGSMILELTSITIFGIMGILLLISSDRIRRKMKFDDNDKNFLA